MALINLSTALPEIMPHVPKCPRMMIMNELRKAAIEFCDKSRGWIEVIDPITTIPGVNDYDISGSSFGAMVVSIEEMVSPSREVTPKTEKEMDMLNPLWRRHTGAIPEIYIMLTQSTLRLYPTPTTTIQVDVKASIKPSRTSDLIDSVVFDEYYAGIAAGALAELVAMPAQSWSNPEMHVYYKAKFNSAVDKSESDRMKGFSRAPIRSAPVGDIGVSMRSGNRRR